MAKGFKHGGSGVPLNFKVVGNPQPTNPKENTIWINTDVKITSYQFAATQPSSPTAGMVWIPTGTSSTAEFNALKKNGIQVYPVSAKQYVSGAWVDKTAKSYQGGKWVDWWNGELYKSGNEYTSVTGGWVGKALRGNQSGSDLAPTITRNTGSIYAVMNTSAKGGVLHTKNKIDLTNYKTITFKGTIKSTNASAAVGFGVWSSFGSYWKSATAINTYEGVKTITDGSLDVSGVSGSCYVGFGLYHEANVTITEVTLK